MSSLRGKTDAHPGEDGSRTLDADVLVGSALDCYRNALRSADYAEAAAWIKAGAWFERLIPVADLPPVQTQDDQVPDRRTWCRTPMSSGALVILGTSIHIVRLHDLSYAGACISRPAGLDTTADILELTVPGHMLGRPARVVKADTDLIRLAFLPETRIRQAAE